VLAAGAGDGLEQRLGHAAVPLQDEARGGERVREVVDEGLHLVVALALVGEAADDDALVREEGRRLGGVHEREERIVPVVVGGGAHLHLLHDERAVLVADELLDEAAHAVAQDDLVVAPQQRDRRRGPAHPATSGRASRAASTAARTSAVRRAPRTSWARRTRAPRAMPRA
jgi:hypothetical protein